MESGTKFAMALIFVMVAMVLFFVAFHPNQSVNVQELIQEFQSDLDGSAADATKGTIPQKKAPTS